MSDNNYTDYYKSNKFSNVYPTEFVVRSFLGKYPRLQSNNTGYNGKKVLDLGFGDGRNMPLLKDLGFEIHGVEVTDVICEHIREKCLVLEFPLNLEREEILKFHIRTIFLIPYWHVTHVIM